MIFLLSFSTQRPHLGILLDYYAVGGIEQQTVALANALVEHGVCKVTLLIAGEYEYFIRRFELRDDVQVARLKQLTFQQVLAFFKAKKFDALVVQQLFNHVNRQIAERLSASGLKVIVQAHWAVISRAFESEQLDQVFRKAWAVVTLSRVDARYIQERIGARAFFIPNIVVERVQSSLGRSIAKSVLFLGRYHVEKRPDLALEVARRVLELELDCDFIFAGFVQDRALFSDLQEQKYSSGLNRLRLLPDQQDPSILFQGAAVLLSTSPWEGFGLSIAEAVASGVPVCMFSIPGAEVLKLHGVERVAFGDLQGLTDCVLRTLKGQRNDKEDTRASVRERFALQKTLEEWRDLIEGVLEPTEMGDLPYEAALWEAAQASGVCAV